MPLIWLQTLVLMTVAAAASLVPVVLGHRDRLPLWLAPLATGAMIGLCCCGLLPEVVREGGNWSLTTTLAVATLYAVAHLKPWRRGSGTAADAAAQHQHEAGGHAHGHVHIDEGLTVLFTSIFAHSLFDGALLVLANQMMAQASLTVVLSLAIHKGFEALSLASILLIRTLSWRKTLAWLVVYAGSFPLGVLLALSLTGLFAASRLEHVAFVIMSIAMGNLLGCLAFDFVLPCLNRAKQQKGELVWLAAGALTAGVMVGYR